MVNLILNENMKLYRRWRTWIMIGLMVGAVLLGSFVTWYYDNKDATADNWRQHVEEEMKFYQDQLERPRLSEGEKAFYEERLALHEYRLAEDIPSEDGTMWPSINGSAEFIVLITLFTVIVAGDSLAGEFSTGTIKLLLTRPVSRLKILIAKYASMLMFGLLLLVILFSVSVLTNGLLYQFQHMDLPLLAVGDDGQVVEKNMVANLWQTYLLNGVSTVMFVTMAFMISAAFRSSAMAIGFSIFSLFAGFIFVDLVRNYAWSKYILFANIDLSEYLNEQPFRDEMTLSFSIIVLAVYFALFNLVAWYAFTRRDVAA